MNYIDTIEIKNFKSIRHQKIEGCKRINIFIGYPNVGKSNLIEALSIFSLDDSNYNFSSFVRLENLTTLFYNGEINNQIEVRLNNKHRYVANYRKDSVEFEQQFEKEGTSFSNADDGKVHLDHSDRIRVRRTFQLDQNNISVTNYKYIDFLDQTELNNIRKYEFNKRIQYSNKGFSFLDFPYGANIFNIISTNEVLLKEVTELFTESNLEFLYDTRQQGYTILKRTKKGIFTVPYNLLADTLQRIIFFKAAIYSNKERVLLFEEPEAHMFPPYISKFTADIMFDKNNNQYFIGTHSPFVLNDFMEDLERDQLAIFAVGYKKETGETIVKRIKDEELDEIYQYGVDLFFNLEDYLKDVVP